MATAALPPAPSTVLEAGAVASPPMDPAAPPVVDAGEHEVGDGN